VLTPKPGSSSNPHSSSSSSSTSHHRRHHSSSSSFGSSNSCSSSSSSSICVFRRSSTTGHCWHPSRAVVVIQGTALSPLNFAIRGYQSPVLRFVLLLLLQQQLQVTADNRSSSNNNNNNSYTSLTYLHSMLWGGNSSRETRRSFRWRSVLKQSPTVQLWLVFCVIFRAVPNILFVFYSVRIVGRIVYSYSAK